MPLLDAATSQQNGTLVWQHSEVVLHTLYQIGPALCRKLQQCRQEQVCLRFSSMLCPVLEPILYYTGSLLASGQYEHARDPAWRQGVAVIACCNDGSRRKRNDWCDNQQQGAKEVGSKLLQLLASKLATREHSQLPNAFERSALYSLIRVMATWIASNAQRDFVTTALAALAHAAWDCSRGAADAEACAGLARLSQHMQRTIETAQLWKVCAHPAEKRSALLGGCRHTLQ